MLNVEVFKLCAMAAALFQLMHQSEKTDVVLKILDMSWNGNTKLLWICVTIENYCFLPLSVTGPWGTRLKQESCAKILWIFNSKTFSKHKPEN